MNPQVSRSGPPLTAQPLPRFGLLDVVETPQGFLLSPRGSDGGFWIEAIVWLTGFCVLGAFLAFGGTTLRVIGAIGIGSIGLRALFRLARALFGGALRKLRLVLRVPRPYVAGAFETVSLGELAHVSVTQRGNGTYLRAVTHAGKECWLVDLNPAHAADYRALAGWLDGVARELQAR